MFKFRNFDGIFTEFPAEPQKINFEARDLNLYSIILYLISLESARSALCIGINFIKSTCVGRKLKILVHHKSIFCEFHKLLGFTISTAGVCVIDFDGAMALVMDSCLNAHQSKSRSKPTNDASSTRCMRNEPAIRI